MAEEKESTSIPLSQAENGGVDPEDPAKAPPSSPNSSTRKACCFVLQSWVSKKFMTGCVVLFPVAVTFFITWWFIQFVDGFFSPLYERLGIDIFGLGFITSLLFVFFVGVFVSSWMGAAVFSVGEWVIKRMPFVRHLYSASKQISSAISPDQNTTAFKEVAIIRHPRVGEYAFGFITSTVTLQRENEDEELCSVFVPTNHLYIGDIFLVNSKDIIRPNLSIREGIEIIVSGGMTMPQVISPQERQAELVRVLRFDSKEEGNCNREMDRYQRVEKPKAEIPINETEIRITTQGRTRNYITYATTLLQEKGSSEIVLKAMGRAISKTVMIAELIKRRIAGLHQNTSIGSTDITDMWEPLEEGLLPLETTRHVSTIAITLSTKELEVSSIGYQPPLSVDQVKPLNEFEEEGAPEAPPGTRGRGQGGRGRSRGRGNYGAVGYNGDGWDGGRGFGGRGRGRGNSFRGRGRGYGAGGYYDYSMSDAPPAQGRGRDRGRGRGRGRMGRGRGRGRYSRSDLPVQANAA
ncbi:hypothetical protein V6N11_043445 [Hibiscus sabdariffa]|uniref:DNA/RNA-binding protein Alba-like domain-containing protein n=1 Tax=Hibiscus sabdariffa TaxID=183260 RepID=A0ABR2RC79_9ROSI